MMSITTTQPTTKTSNGTDSRKRDYLSISRKEWGSALLFMLSLSMVGLHFYPALLFVIGFMLNSWRKDRYGFLIMITLLIGGYGLTYGETFPIKVQDIMLVVSVVLFFTFRKAPIIRKVLTIFCSYALLLIFVAMFSRESISVQFITMRGYLTFAFFIIPIVVFSSIEFDFKEFSRRLMPYVFMMCIFYIADAFIFSGNLLVPTTHMWSAQLSTFYEPYINPLSFHPFRKYPPGLYIIILAIYPVARLYKLRIWQWIIVVLALFSTQTLTFIACVIGTYILFTSRFIQILKYSLFIIIAFVALYYIDGALPRRGYENSESAMRIKSTIDQFIELSDYVDDEDLAQFGSGRIGQAIPKFEVVNREGRQLTGLGFLHTDKTKIKDYVITNEYYTDIANNEEVATGIEVALMQLYITIGIIGMFVHLMFFVLLYCVIRKLDYSGYFLSILCASCIAGLGGFFVMYNVQGLCLAALSYSAIILNSRSKLPGFRTPWIKNAGKALAGNSGK